VGPAEKKIVNLPLFCQNDFRRDRVKKSPLVPGVFSHLLMKYNSLYLSEGGVRRIKRFKTFKKRNILINNRL
jgi:hypothetical protein